MAWQQLQLALQKDQVDFVSEVILGLGGLSITLTDTQDDPILEAPLNEMPIWDFVTITALFEQDCDLLAISDSINQICQLSTGVKDFSYLADKEWVLECAKDFRSMLFGQNLWVRPSWHKEDELGDKLNNKAVIIEMDPGLAFGSGTHQTTYLCLQYLEAHPPKGLSVIDYGCGSGVLAIAASKLGAKRVVAIDYDPQAVQATKDNASHNNSDIITYCADNLNKEPTCDLLLANILASVLIEKVVEMSSKIANEGTLVLSGILDTQIVEVIKAYQPFFSHISHTQKQDWCCVVANK